MNTIIKTKPSIKKQNNETDFIAVDTVMHDGLNRVFPAAVLHIRQAGNVIFERAYGYLDPETRQRPTQPDSLFDLASLTKVFTATLFMMLVEVGRVSLETSVTEVLPEFAGTRPIVPTQDSLSKALIPRNPQFAGQTVDASTITFRHLLTHTSGLAAWRSLYRIAETDALLLPHQVSAVTRARRIAAIHDQDEYYGFAYPPDTRIVYSDLGFILLGEAIARLVGVPLEIALRQTMLEPLGLGATIYNPLINVFPRERIVPTEICPRRQRRCIGEVHDKNSASLGGVAGHAGLFSTAAEVAALGQLYLNGGIYNGGQRLRSETVAEMVRVQVGAAENTPRGLGWHQRSLGYSSSGRAFGPRSFGHTGFTGTSLWVDPDQELVVTLLTNRVYHGRNPQPIHDFRPRLHDAVMQETLDVYK